MCNRNEKTESFFGVEAEVRHGLELLEDVIVRLSKNSITPLSSGICQQLTSGNLPNLTQHLDAIVTTAGKEVVAS